MVTRPIAIMLIEDNPADIALTEESLERSKIVNELTAFMNGESALGHLQQCVKEGTSLPDVILLDLDMPGISGHDVLEQLKSHEELRRIPVVVLTSSRAEEDILRSYDLHVNCYITKPLDLNQFTMVVKSIEHFWFSIVSLPST